MLTIRNDDVSADTNLAHLKEFCGLCDRYGVRIIQAVTPWGPCIPISRRMTNREIQASSTLTIEDHRDLLDYLRIRPDAIAVHGLRHTHQPSFDDILFAARLLRNLGLTPTYFVPPFNEGRYGATAHGLTVSAGEASKFEECVVTGSRPLGPIAYLHSWRFDPACPHPYVHPALKRPFTLNDLEDCLRRIR